MKEFETREEAFASQNYDPTKVKMEGVPEHIISAAKAFINLCVVHDAVNPDFNPDYTDGNQWKYEAWHEMGSPSGAGFSFNGCDYWFTGSHVGSRLVSESGNAARLIARISEEDYKNFKVYDRSSKK